MPHWHKSAPQRRCRRWDERFARRLLAGECSWSVVGVEAAGCRTVRSGDQTSHMSNRLLKLRAVQHAEKWHPDITPEQFQAPLLHLNRL